MCVPSTHVAFPQFPASLGATSPHHRIPHCALMPISSDAAHCSKMTHTAHNRLISTTSCHHSLARSHLPTKLLFMSVPAFRPNHATSTHTKCRNPRAINPRANTLVCTSPPPLTRCDLLLRPLRWHQALGVCSRPHVPWLQVAPPAGVGGRWHRPRPRFPWAAHGGAHGARAAHHAQAPGNGCGVGEGVVCGGGLQRMASV